MTTSYPCPRCGATAALPDGCPGCGAGPDPDAAEVIRLDGQIAGLTGELQEARAGVADLTQRLHDARARVSALDRRLHDTRATRNQVAARVVAGRTPGSVPSPGPAPIPVAAAGPAPASRPAPVSFPEPAEPRLSSLTVQNVLFTLGGLLLVVAAAVFTAVAWAQVGVTGRALLLAGATVAILAVPPFAVRRGLTAAAETLAAVGLLMILLDGFAAWAVGFLGVGLWDPWAYAATVLAIAAAVALGYSATTGLRGPRIAALLMAQPVLPLVAAANDAGLVGWSLACTGVAALDLAALRTRPTGFTADRGGVLAYLCAVVAGGTGGLLALRALAVAVEPGPAALAGLVLLLPPILLLTWTLLTRERHGQAWAAGLLVVVAGLAGARWAWTLSLPGSDFQAARLALVALVLAAVAAVLPRTRPVSPATSLSPAGDPSASGFPLAGATPSAAAAASRSAHPAPPSGLPSATTPPSTTATSGSSSATTPPSTTAASGSSSATTPPSATAASGADGVSEDSTPATTSGSPAGTPASSPGASGSPTGASASPAGTSASPAGDSGSSAADSPGASGPDGRPGTAGAGGRLGEATGISWLRRVPGEVGFGAWVGALLVGLAPGIAVLVAAMAGAVHSVEAARPVFGAPMGAGVAGAEPDLVVAAVVTAVAYALMLPRRVLANLGLTAFFVVGLIVPGAFGLTWWAATVAAVIAAVIALGLAARSRTMEDTGYRGVFCLAAVMHAVITGFGRAEVAAAVFGLIAVFGVGAALGLRNAPRRADVGAAGMIAGLLAVPVTMWLWLFAADVPVTGQVRATLGVAVALCLVVYAIYRQVPVYGPQSLGVALVVAAFAPVWAAAGEDPAVLYSAAALLLIVALLPVRHARSTAGTVAAVQPGLALLAFTATDLAVVLLEPWTALRDIWSDIPPQQSPVAWSSVVALTMAGIAASVAGAILVCRRTIADSATIHSAPGEPSPVGAGPADDAGPGSAGGFDVGHPADGTSSTSAGPGPGPSGGRVPRSARWIAAWVAVPFGAVLVPMVFAAGGAGWPAVPIAGLVTGLAGLLAMALTPGRDSARGLAAALFGALAAAGVAGSAAGHGATLAAFVLVLVAGGVAGWRGLVESERVTGWWAAAVSVVVVAYTLADLTSVGIAGPPLFVLAAAALVVGLEAGLAWRRPREAWAPFVVGHGSALVAVFLTESLGWAALVCKLWALVLTVRALRPGEARRGRFGHAVAAGVVGLVGWWLLLASRDVGTTEVYTLPAAVLALIAGWFARRGRPDLPSWSAYGAALAAAFLPTLVVIANSTAGEPHYLRRLLLGVGALLVLLAGARARLQAPVVTGGGTLLLVALHELIQFWDLLPRWVPLAVGGLLLVGVATTMEQRRRDLARLRAAISRMA
ncbi:SCO7613 C-terminal domain-containing membrane protein [Actinoplanes philippinensis]|uniref:SCO7613 C-terminal domain-containing membrane protein n=1 Tax=Actinoplanes philippinensis TaxID=35752 RepID=UPI0033C7F4A9